MTAGITRNRRWLRARVLEMLAEGKPLSALVIARRLDYPLEKVTSVLYNARRDRLVESDGDVRGALYWLAAGRHVDTTPKPAAPRQWFHL